MPLFVQLAGGVAPTDALKATIAARLATGRSPRHVPNDIIATPEIPLMPARRKMEAPVRKLLMGLAVDQVASRDATRNPAALVHGLRSAAAGL